MADDDSAMTDDFAFRLRRCCLPIESTGDFPARVLLLEGVVGVGVGDESTFRNAFSRRLGGCFSTTEFSGVLGLASATGDDVAAVVSGVVVPGS